MSFIAYNLGKFKQGQFDITEDCKSKSETNKIISIYDGNVTTYIYEKPKYFKLDKLKSFVKEAYGYGFGSYLATYNEDEEGNIFVNFNGSVGGTIDGIESICFYDEDGDEEYLEIFKGNKDELLVTSAFMSIDEVLENYPNLNICKK